MKLGDLQQQFILGLYHKPNEELLSQIKKSNIDKEQLIGIYRNNLGHNLLNCLRLTFENVLRFLKDEKFNELANKYLFKNISISNNLDDYGDKFSQFLLKEEGCFIADVAKLDWLKQQSYLAKNDEDFDLDKIKLLPPNELFDLKLKLSNSLFLAVSDYNLLAKRYQNSKSVRQNYFLIYRHKLSGVFEVDFVKISMQEYQFLQAVLDGLNLFEIYEKYEIDIKNILQKFLSNRVIVGFL